MPASLDVTIGPDGTLRDTRGRPMVVIFNSRQEESNPPPPAKEQGDQTVEAPSLQFVSHCEHDKSHKLRSNTRVRRHVMQRYWRKQKADAIRTVASHTVLPHDEMSRDWAADVESSFLASPSSGQARGFWSMATMYISQYSMPERQRMLQLANHFAAVGQILFKSEQDYKATIGSAMSDPALFHMHLLTAAIHYNFANNNSDIQELLFHQTKAIQLVNSQVIHQPSEIQDTLMSAVAYLAVTEWYLGDYAAWEHHFNGLAQMVELRGGLATLNKSMRTKVFIANFVANAEMDYPIKFHYWDDRGHSTADLLADVDVGDQRLRAEEVMVYFAAEAELFAFLQFRQLFFTRIKKKPQYTGPHSAGQFKY